MVSFQSQSISIQKRWSKDMCTSHLALQLIRNYFYLFKNLLCKGSNHFLNIEFHNFLTDIIVSRDCIFFCWGGKNIIPWLEWEKLHFDANIIQDSICHIGLFISHNAAWAQCCSRCISLALTFCGVFFVVRLHNCFWHFISVSWGFIAMDSGFHSSCSCREE